ncbi:hypothetical protein LCGC14_2199530 [marine sediment metagenome]|uniref:Lipoprotein n=1 Tax=marine sediment metagenome TaxID=412755 RepID=A0A0F9DHB4_9ZZZZ
MSILRWFTPFFLLGVIGCANVPFTRDECNAAQYETAHEVNNCLKLAEDYVQEQFAKAERRVEKRDALVAFLNACDKTKGLVIVETIKIGRSLLPNKRQQRDALKEYGYRYTHYNIHRNARMHDFTCLMYADVKRMLQQAGF